MSTVQPDLRFYDKSYTGTGTWTSYATTHKSRQGHTSWVTKAGLLLMGGDFIGSYTTSEIVNAGRSFRLVHKTQ